MQPTEIFIDGQHILYDAGEITNISANWFEPAYWRKQDALTGQAPGRGTSYFFQADGKDYVLRHYRRGGSIASLLGDRYLCRRLQMTRAWQEWHLLAALHGAGLPVPRPVAARVIPAGLFYRADIIMEKLPVTATLAEILKRHALRGSQWQAIGRLLRRFHNAGVYHADLNAHNILLGMQNWYLVDFDKCNIRDKKNRWRQKNLDRFQRSLRKLADENEEFHFSANDWWQMRQAYEAK